MTTERQIQERAAGASSAPARRPGPFSVAGEQDRLYSLTADGRRRRIDPAPVTGRFWRVRLGLAVGLIAAFVGAPHLTIAQKPALFFDLARRQFTILGTTFHPTDGLILLSFGACVIVAFFALSALFGRLWCGYACPHPVYLEFVYRPLETLLEGRPALRRRRRRAGGHGGRRVAKGALYLAVSLLLSATFVAYFVGWAELWPGLLIAPAQHAGSLVATLGVTAAMFFNFSSFRDQLCTVACPYGRLQTVLYDQDTIIVGYDPARGEPRGRRREPAGAGEQPPPGDCIDCGRCVSVCPTGMDIRRGLQMECIGCAQCVEVCDEVMARVQRPPGLIRYTSLRELATGERRFLRPRVALYGLVFLAALGPLLALTVGRAPAEAELLRTGHEPYRLVGQGQVANLLRLRLTNRVRQAQRFTVRLSRPAGARLVVSESPFAVPPGEVGTLTLVAMMPDRIFQRGQAEGLFVIESDAGVHLERPFTLLGPYN